MPKPDLSDFRQTYTQIFDINITSVGLTTNLFLQLLKSSPSPQVINVSSGRASVSRVTSGKNSSLVVIPYSVSKLALNMMTYEMARAEPDVVYHLANPGHCKTAFNGYRGVKDPVDGAKVVVELVCAEKGVYAGGFWEVEEDGMKVVPW
jgi:NAD(P)-dependent dehydrogenase (short-subunit alcohol dehydrogenase family)